MKRSTPSSGEDPSGRRAEIASVALGHFLERGYTRASMSGIARTVGIEKASLYYHFAGKEDLFLQALAVNFAGPMDRIGEMAATEPDPEALLRGALGILYDVMVDGPIGRLATVIAETARTVPSVARGFHDDFIRRFEQAIETAHRPAIDAGLAAELPPEERNLTVFAPLLQIAITATLFQAHPDLHEKYVGAMPRDRYVAMTLRALGVEGS
jgi:AcrR family transcriptional regulator